MKRAEHFFKWSVTSHEEMVYCKPVMKRVNTSFSVIVTSHEESEHFF